MSETPPSSGPNESPSSGTLLLPESCPEDGLSSGQAEQAHPVLIGHYRLQRPLGLGGIAEVYLAVDEQGHPVAIKRLRRELAGEPVERARLEREAIALERIRHPNVLRLHASGHDDKSQRPYLACEFIPGLHLHDFVQQFGDLASEIMGWVGLLLARALTSVHAAHIIHRDLKPTNVMIDLSRGPSQGRVVLIDYGSALLTDLTPLTPSGYPVGTPGFAAPEQLDRTLGMPPGTIDERADVYGLGVLLYTLVAKGLRPFHGRSLRELLRAMASERYEPLSRIHPRVPSYLEQAVAWCLRYRPVDRPSLAQLRELLSRGLEEDGFEDAEVEMRRLVADPAKVLADFGPRMVQMMVKKSLVLMSLGWRDEMEETRRRALAWGPTDPQQVAFLQKLQKFDGAPVERLQEMIAEVVDAVRSEQALSFAAEEDEDEDEEDEEDEDDEGEDGEQDEDDEGEDEEQDEDEEDEDEEDEEGEDEGEEDEASQEDEPPEAASVEQEEAPTGAIPEAPPAPPPPVMQPVEPPPTVRVPSVRPWWQRRAQQAVLLVAAAVVVLIGLRVGSALQHRKWHKLFRLPLTLRQLDGRTSHPAGAEYVPYPLGEQPAPDRKAPTPDLDALSQMEDEGDLHGIATAWLLAGELSQAEVYLDLAAPRSEPGEAGAASLHPDVDSDRSLIEMNRGHLDVALRLTDVVLRARPEHRPALWNRALVLGRLALGLSGAAIFDRIEALGEPGWSVEAGQRAAYLRRPIEERRQRWQEVLKTGREMADGGRIQMELVDKSAGYARAFLYDAVRAAPDAGHVWALLPFAKALDERYGGDVLQRYVQKIAARPFAHRAPLAKIYQQLLANYGLLDAQAQDRYLAELRRAGEDDLILGTLVVVDRVRDHLAEYRRLAQESGDPWFVLIADTEEAKAETAQGEHRQAEERLLAALDTCQRQKMEYRCVGIENALVSVYRSMDRLPEAEAHAQAGRALAKKTGDWQAETLFLRKFNDIAQARTDVSLSQALLDEIDWRDPESCERRRYTHVRRADGYLRELRYAEAREELREAPLCHQPLTLQAAGILAHLDRVGMPAEPWQQLRAEIADLRLRGGLGPGALAVAVHIEGVLLLRHLRHEGEILLRRAQIMSESLRVEDRDAQLAYTYSYRELALAAGQAGEFDRAQELLAESHGARSPQRCTFGTVIDGERSLTVAADAEGHVRGHYDDHRVAQPSDGPGAQQDALLASLSACAEIHVYPEFSAHAQAGVLPVERAWTFHKVRSEPYRWGKSRMHRLVVRNILRRSQEDTPPLPPWSSRVQDGETVTYLEGKEATFERVQVEMTKYTEVVFHVPCVFRDGEQQLLLSPGTTGKDTLTVSDVQRMQLPNVRLVILTSCTRRQATGYFDAPRDLPSAFISAGVGAVLASYDTVLDVEDLKFFDDVAARIRTGQPPAVALRDVRVRWIEKKKKDWVKGVVVYD